MNNYSYNYDPNLDLIYTNDVYYGRDQDIKHMKNAKKSQNKYIKNKDNDKKKLEKTITIKLLIILVLLLVIVYFGYKHIKRHYSGTIAVYGGIYNNVLL